jgi:septum formation inhibitor MinC
MHFVYGECSGKANAGVRRYGYVGNDKRRIFKAFIMNVSIQIQINKVTQKLTNLIGVSARF